MNSLDDMVYRFVKAELFTHQRNDVDETLQYLSKRFRPVDEIGQRQLLFRQLRQSNKTLQEFHTELLEQTTYAFINKNQLTIDKEVRDTFIVCINSNRRAYI